MSEIMNLKTDAAKMGFTNAINFLHDFFQNEWDDFREFAIHISHDDFDGMGSTIVGKAVYRLLNPVHTTKEPHHISWINTSKIGADFYGFLRDYLDEFYKNYMAQYDTTNKQDIDFNVNLLITDINFDLEPFLDVLRPIIKDLDVHFNICILDHHVTKYPDGAKVTRYSPSKGVEYVMDAYSGETYDIYRVICNSISATKILANIVLSNPLINFDNDPFYASGYNDFVDRLNAFAAIASKYDTGHWGNWDSAHDDVDPSIIWNTMAINARTDHQMVDFIDATAKAFVEIVCPDTDYCYYHNRPFGAIEAITPKVHKDPGEILRGMLENAKQQISGMNEMYEQWARTTIEIVGCGGDELKHRITPYQVYATRHTDGGYQLVIHRLKTTDCPNPPENISVMVKVPENFPSNCVMYFAADLATNVESKYNYSMFAKRFLEERDQRYQKGFPMAICRVWLVPNEETDTMTVECSFRSLNLYEPSDKNYVSVRDICALNGGGGHPHAAGFRVEIPYK